MTRSTRRLARVTVAGVFALASMLGPACRSTPPPPPDFATLNWTTYTNPVVGYSLEVPEVYDSKTAHGDKDVMFRYERFPVLVVNYLDEEEGQRRGLWPGHESAGTIELAGLPGKRYVYDHGDGPFVTHTVAYVVPYRGKFLGLEFRSDREAPDAIRQRILDTLRLD